MLDLPVLDFFKAKAAVDGQKEGNGGQTPNKARWWHWALLTLCGLLIIAVFGKLLFDFFFAPDIFNKYGVGWSATGLGLLSALLVISGNLYEVVAQRNEK